MNRTQTLAAVGEDKNLLSSGLSRDAAYFCFAGSRFGQAKRAFKYQGFCKFIIKYDNYIIITDYIMVFYFSVKL